MESSNDDAHVLFLRGKFINFQYRILFKFSVDFNQNTTAISLNKFNNSKGFTSF